MVEPGLYQHFKRKFYTVYGVATFNQQPSPERFIGLARYSEDPEQQALVYVGENGLVLGGALNGVDKSLEYVVYQGLYESAQFGTRPVWFRPRAMFDDMKDVGDKKVKRFTRVV